MGDDQVLWRTPMAESNETPPCIEAASQIHVRSEVPVDDGAIGRAGCGWVMLSAPGPVPKLDLDLR